MLPIKNTDCRRLISVIYLFFCFQLLSCTGTTYPDESLSGSLTFFASFDQALTADVSNGDSLMYRAPTWNRRNEAVAYHSSNTHLRIAEGEGRYKNALWIDNSYTPVYFYKGKENVDYTAGEWEGTVSFWLRLTPDEDLHDGYSDPIQLTTRAWNDGALFVDFTDVSPRIFRFAFFPDRHVWDPDYRDWDDVPIKERPMIEVSESIFTHQEWVHVAFAYSKFNTGEKNGVVRSYINGTLHGTLDGREKTFTWKPEEIAIWLGYNYRGYVDELAIFNRALRSDEIESIYSLEHGISGILR